jgi:hypothetical protein
LTGRLLPALLAAARALLIYGEAQAMLEQPIVLRPAPVEAARRPAVAGTLLNGSVQ